MEEAKTFIIAHWGEPGKTVVDLCAKQTPFRGNCDQFLSHCTACGGNWGGMLLTGINALYPEVYEAIPDEMGSSAWACLVYVLQLLGVDTEQ